MAARLGSFMYSAAAIELPSDFVYSSSGRACAGVQRPDASRTPGLVANEVTILASTAFAKSITPFHCARVSTLLNPFGAALGGGSESAK
jgi:hypothetical protein